MPPPNMVGITIQKDTLKKIRSARNLAGAAFNRQITISEMIDLAIGHYTDSVLSARVTVNEGRPEAEDKCLSPS